MVGGLTRRRRVIVSSRTHPIRPAATDGRRTGSHVGPRRRPRRDAGRSPTTGLWDHAMAPASPVFGHALLTAASQSLDRVKSCSSARGQDTRDDAKDSGSRNDADHEPQRE